MSHLTLTKIRFANGTWEGQIETPREQAEAPRVEVLYQDRPVPGVTLSEGGTGRSWHLAVPVPAEAVADGVQNFLITDRDSDRTLGSFTLSADADAGEGLRAEVELLRAELDMLKRAFRRHCRETA